MKRRSQHDKLLVISFTLDEKSNGFKNIARADFEEFRTAWAAKR